MNMRNSSCQSLTRAFMMWRWIPIHSTGTTFSKRINKLITVTPRLAPEPADRTAGYRDIPSTKCFTTTAATNKSGSTPPPVGNTGYGS